MTGEPAELDSSIGSWFQAYIDAFAAAVDEPSLGARRLLDFYAVPLVLTTDDGARVFLTEDDVVALVKDLVDGLQADNYSHTETIRTESIDVNRSTTVHRGEFTRRRRDGSEIARIGATYFISKGQTGLRIFAIGAHSGSRLTHDEGRK